MIDDYMKRYSISLEKCIWKLILKYHHTNSEITKMKTAPHVKPQDRETYNKLLDAVDKRLEHNVRNHKTPRRKHR